MTRIVPLAAVLFALASLAPAAPPGKFTFVDLKPYANQKLTDNFGSGREGNNLKALGKGGRTLGGMATKPKDYPAPPHWLYYVKVDDLDAALARVKKGGGQVMHGPMEVPGGDRVAQCIDPQRAAFALHGK